MQVAAANPSYVDEASVPAEVVAKEKEIMLAQMAGDPKNANKPDAVKQKMIEGKIKKFFKENCLVDQEFVKDSDLTVAQYTAKVAKDLGGDIKIVKFTRFQKGEGLEKRADDFAAEPCLREFLPTADPPPPAEALFLTVSHPFCNQHISLQYDLSGRC